MKATIGQILTGPKPIRYYGEGVIEAIPDLPGCEIVRSEAVGFYYAKGFAGKAKNTAFYYRFRTAEQREEYIAKWLANLRTHQEYRKTRQEQRKLLVNPVKVGDIYVCSWGYDQTNVDFYQVVEVKGCYAVIREIGCKSVDQVQSMADHVVAVKDAFLEKAEPMRKKICTRDGGQTTYFSIYDFADAYPWSGNKQYRSWYA